MWGNIIYWQIQFLRNETEDKGENNFIINDPKQNEFLLFIAFKMQEYIYICSISMVLLFVKLIKYVSNWFTRAMIIFRTLETASSDIIYFLIMYLIIFCAFVVMCHIYYGAELITFGSVPESTKTLFLMLMGDLNYLNDMISLDETLSFFFFIFFIVSMQFILMNMFIAFIAESYNKVNNQMRAVLEE